MKTQLISVDKLHPHEKVSIKRLQVVEKELHQEGLLYHPILVDEKHFIILDGHHRFYALQKMGCHRIPCLCLDYNDDSVVTMIPRRKNMPITKRDVITTALSGRVFPYKTTKHIIKKSYLSPAPAQIDSLKV